MKRLLAIGEALIDFIPEETGKELKNVSGFQPAVGGAPANVCGAYVKLGGEAAMITQLGDDPFGDKIVEEFKKNKAGKYFLGFCGIEKRWQSGVFLLSETRGRYAFESRRYQKRMV